MMGITTHRDFKRIRYFVNHLKASRGKFEILEEFELLPLQYHESFEEGSPVNSTLTLGHSKNLALYREEFEKPIVGDTRTYCQDLRRVWLASESLPSYLKKAQKIIDQESDRVDRLMIIVMLRFYVGLAVNLLAKLCVIQVLAPKFEECFASSGRRGTFEDSSRAGSASRNGRKWIQAPTLQPRVSAPISFNSSPPLQCTNTLVSSSLSL